MDIYDDNSATTTDAKASQAPPRRIDFDSPLHGQEKERKLKEMDRGYRLLYKQWKQTEPAIIQVVEVQAADAVGAQDYFGYVPAVARVEPVQGRPAQTVTMQIEGRDLVDATVFEQLEENLRLHPCTRNMALKIATQAQSCVMEDTGTYHEIDALIEEGIKPGGEQARLAYRVMDVLKDACKRNEAAAKEELRRSLERAVCSSIEGLPKHLIQYATLYKRLRLQATDADRQEGSAFEHEWKRKFLASVTPGNDPELRLEVQVIREMAMDTVAGKSVTTMTENLKRREQMRASLGIMALPKKTESAGAVHTKEQGRRAGSADCWNCGSSEHMSYQCPEEKDHDAIREARRKGRGLKAGSKPYKPEGGRSKFNSSHHCDFCDIDGHLDKDCRKKRRAQGPESKPPSKSKKPSGDMQATAAALLPYLMQAMGQGGSSSEEDPGDENLDMACEVDSESDGEGWAGSGAHHPSTSYLPLDFGNVSMQEAEEMARYAAMEADDLLEDDLRVVSDPKGDTPELRLKMVFDVKKDVPRQRRVKAGVILDGSSNPYESSVARIDVLIDSGAEATLETVPTNTCCPGQRLDQTELGSDTSTIQQRKGPEKRTWLWLDGQTELHEHVLMLAADDPTVNFVGDRESGASNATVDSGASGAFSGFREDFGPRARINPHAKPVSLADGRRDHNQLEESIPTAFLDENDKILHIEWVKWRFLDLGPRRLLGTNAITESAQGGSVQFGSGGKGHLHIADTKIPINKIGRLWAVRIELRAEPSGSAASAASHQEELRPARLPNPVGRKTKVKFTIDEWHNILGHESNENKLRKTIENSRDGAIKGEEPMSQWCLTCLLNKSRKTAKTHDKVTIMDALCRKADINPNQVADKAGMFKFVRHQLKRRMRHLKRQHNKRTMLGPEVEEPSAVVDKRNLLEPFELLFTDMCGPFGGEYYNLFIDSRSDHFWIYKLKNKADAVKCVEKMVLHAATGRYQVGAIRHDGSGEQTSEVWKGTLARHGIRDQCVMPRSQWSNGRCEKGIGQSTTSARAMLYHNMSPIQRFRGPAFAHSATVHNVMAQERLGWKSPHDILYGCAPSMRFMRTFGAECIIVKPLAATRSGTKDQPTSVHGVYIGPAKSGGQGYECFDTHGSTQLYRTQNIIMCRQSLPREKPLRQFVTNGEIPEARPVHHPDGPLTPLQSLGEMPYLSDMGEKDDVDRGKDVPTPTTEGNNMIRGDNGFEEKVTAETDLSGKIQDGLSTDPSENSNSTDGAVSDHNSQWEKEEGGVGTRLSMGKGMPERSGTVNINQVPPPRMHMKASTIHPTAPPLPRRSSQRTRAGVRAPMLGFDDHAACGARSGKSGPITKLHIAIVGDWEEVHDRSFDSACEIIEIGDRGKILSVVRRHEAGTPPPTDHCAAAMSYGAAISRNQDLLERAAFIKARDEEFFLNLVQNGVVEYVHPDDVPEDTIPLGMMWTFVWKTCPTTGVKLRAKARCVIRGDQSIAGIHHPAGDTYSPTPAMNTVVAAMVHSKCDKGVAARGKFDVKAAFTLARPSQTNYLYTTEGVHKYDDEGRKYLLRQLMNLYGTIEAAKRWLDLACVVLKMLGLVRSMWDPCLFRIVLKEEDLDEYVRRPAPTKDSEEELEADKKSKRTGTSNHRSFNGSSKAAIAALGEDVLAALDDSAQYGMAEMHHGSAEIPEVISFDMSQVIESYPANGTNGYLWLNLVIYIDDGYVYSNSVELKEAFQSKFLQRFPGTHENDPSTMLGLSLIDHDIGFELAQPALQGKLMEEARMPGTKVCPTPMLTYVDTAVRPTTDADHAKVEAAMPNFANVNGMLGFLAHTMPALKFAYGQLSRAACNPHITHVLQMRRTIRWVRGQKGKGICFLKQEQESELEVYVDTSYDVDVFTSIMARRYGGIVYARSMRQKTVKTSTHTAELVGLSEGVRVVVYLRALFRDMGIVFSEPTTVWCDNRSVVQVVNRMDGQANQVKHYKLRLAWVRERINEGDVIVKHVKTENNIADLLTKPLSAQLFRRLYPQIRGTERMVNDHDPSLA